MLEAKKRVVEAVSAMQREEDHGGVSQSYEVYERLLAVAMEKLCPKLN